MREIFFIYGRLVLLVFRGNAGFRSRRSLDSCHTVSKGRTILRSSTPTRMGEDGSSSCASIFNFLVSRDDARVPP